MIPTSLPFKDNTSNLELVRDVRVRPGSSSAATILVVDDEPRNVVLLRTLLESHGYTLCTAANGEQALALAQERFRRQQQ